MSGSEVCPEVRMSSTKTVLEHAVDRITSKPGVVHAEVNYDDWEDEWELTIDKESGTSVNMRVSSFSNFGQTFDLDVNAFVQHSPDTKISTKRYSLRYPELETAILRLADLDPVLKEPFGDRMASDLSDPQQDLLMLIYEDIEDGPENHTYSTRIPKRVDPRTLENLHDKGYIVHERDDFAAPEKSNYPPLKRIKMTPSGSRHCRLFKKESSCGQGCECGDYCPCGDNCDCK